MSRSGSDFSRDASDPAATAALRVAQEAAAQVPAYGRFLRLAGYDATRLHSFADFQRLPLMDKASYMARYRLAERCRRRDLPRAHIVTVSSGSAGPGTLWPRFPEQDALWLRAIADVLQDHFRVRERWTLMVLAQAIGPWGFGTSMTQAGQRLFGGGEIRGTVVTPGLNPEEALRFVEQLSPEYDQTILVSYPAVLPTLLELGEQQGLRWPELHAGALTSGEGVSEPQRERILQLLGRDPERLDGFVSMFGASEVAGIIGYETRLCLLIRRLCRHNPALAESLFGSPMIPSLHQYDPRRHFLEAVDGELVLTTRGAVPLVRYNTHDRGGLLTAVELAARCRALGYDLRAELAARGFGPEQYAPLPFLYAFGRSDGVIVHGANVYRDHVAYVLDEADLRSSHTGNFQLAATTAPDGQGTVQVTVELAPATIATEDLRRQYQQRLLAGLQRLNAGFRTVYQASRGRIGLDVTLVPFGQLELRGPKRQRVTPVGAPRVEGESRGDGGGDAAPS